MEVVHWFSDWFWDESHWFPPGVNWTHLRSTEAEKFPDFGDLRLPIFYAFVILAIRAAFEWGIARPLGRAFGIKDTGSELTTILGRLHRWYTQNFASNKSSLSAQSDGGLSSNSSIDDSLANGSMDHADRSLYDDAATASSSKSKSQHRFARTRRISAKRMHLVAHKSLLDKFSESCWRFTYYLFIFVYGTVVLWNKPWVGNSAYFWYGYPFIAITPEIWWYYMIELSFYWSLAISQFFDVKRKDFWVNFIHHIATILLMCFSWADNFVRPGTVVLAIHDAADFWMEAAKMARYCKRNALCNFLFMIFTAVWFVTRVGLFPYWIIYSAMIEAPALVGFYAAYYVFNVLLMLLLVLHIFWSIMILRIVIIAIKSGESDDVRSDDEDEDDD